MKNFLLMTALVAVAAFIAACGAPATNTNTTNATANAAKPAAAAPTADVFLDLEKKANEAYAKGDSAYFQTLLSEKAVMSMGKNHMTKADIVKMMGTTKCELKGEVKLSEPQMSKIDNDTYAFTYKNDTVGQCGEGPDGKMQDLVPMRASTVYVRSGEKWQAAWHSETPIMPVPAADKKDEKAVTPEAKKEEPKKEEPKKDEAKAGDKTAAADAKPEPPKPSANTDALVKAQAAGWEAFRNKDAKYFETNLTSAFAFVTPMGGYIGTKAEAVKTWTETMKCEGITKTAVSDGFSNAISPTVEILTAKGTSDGTCDGQNNGDLWQTAVYVKEGDAWKLAFMFETMPMPGM